MSSEMRILTLWQPWATLIALGLKRYETRSWGTSYRGKLAIHAAKRPFVSADGVKTLDKFGWMAWLEALELAHEAGLITDQSRLPFSNELPLGCIVAIADLTNCFFMTEKESQYAWKHSDNSRICPAPVCSTKEQLFEASGFGAIRVDEPIKGMMAVPVQRLKRGLEEVISIANQTPLERIVGNWQPGRFAWRLENIYPLTEPIPFKGGQGLRTLDDPATLLAIAARIDFGIGGAV